VDFFTAQDKARRKTKLLLGLYAAAVGSIILALYAVIAVMAAAGTSDPAASGSIVWSPQLLALVALGTGAIIGGASLYKIHSLKAGGAAVARSVGGTEVNLSTVNPEERRLLNIVEEMAIASGVPMPAVFILEEEGINAFAAGYGIQDAAVAVTRGCLQSLSRDELQGVVAHEFSHILNGDMRINIRLLGPLFGLLVIAMLGRVLLYSGGRSHGSRNVKGRGGIIAFGIAVMIIGYIGLFFGRLIQAAISRQREFLADSAAVQFTRNPSGIAGALRRIGHRKHGSAISNEHAVETAHMFFAKALGGGLATHPPLPRRIRAIDPQWDGSFLPPLTAQSDLSDTAAAPAAQRPQSKDGTAGASMQPAMTVAMAGSITAEAMRAAVESRVRLHEVFGNALADPQQARLLVHALILHADPDQRAAQIKAAAEIHPPLDSTALATCASQLEPFGAAERFNLLKLLFATLRKLPPSVFGELPSSLRTLADVDQQRSPRESLILAAVQQQTAAASQPSGASLIRSVQPVATEAAGLLAAVANMQRPDAAAADFASAIAPQPDLRSLAFPAQAPGPEALERLLPALARLDFPLRKQLLTAACQLALADGSVSRDEWNTVCLVALALDIPLPPALR
jgi:Zn-dependent protease with chaperone function